MRHVRKQRLHIYFILVEGLVIFLTLFLGVIVYANWDAVKNELAYALRRTPNTADNVTIASPSPTAANPTATPLPIHEPAHIIIGKIGVDAPIQWNIPADQTIDALNTGVAHLAGTAKLGEVGNVFITGHSSDYSWKNNPYAAVFSLLPKLTIDDAIAIREHGQLYLYRVAETKIVRPDQVEVADPTTTPVLTLMTCFPIGTTRDRFIVHATLVSSPQSPTETKQSSAGILPEIKFR